MVNKYYIKTCITSYLLFLSIVTFADTKTVGDLVKIQSDTIIYRAKKERAQALLELKQISQLTGEGNYTSSELPVIKNVQGKKPNLYVILLYPDGLELSVKRGDLLPNGFVVSQVTAKIVSIVNPTSKKEVRLGFSPRNYKINSGNKRN
ncbi:MAG: type IV pilus biogenesis protein PilP (plasmid) [Candidatus Symbiodolus clandestinus]